MSATDRRILARPLTREAFAPFGDVIDTDWPHHYPINQGKAKRYHGLAKVEAEGPGAEVLISIFHGTPYDFPLQLSMVERHPLGSQAFVPLTDFPFLVVVAEETEGGPGEPIAFRTAPGQGVNIDRNVWHGILTPLDGVSDFAVVDRGGEGVNLEEHFYEAPFLIAD